MPSERQTGDESRVREEVEYFGTPGVFTWAADVEILDWAASTWSADETGAQVYPSIPYSSSISDKVRRCRLRTRDAGAELISGSSAKNDWNPKTKQFCFSNMQNDSEEEIKKSNPAYMSLTSFVGFRRHFRCACDISYRALFPCNGGETQGRGHQCGSRCLRPRTCCFWTLQIQKCLPEDGVLVNVLREGL